METALAGDVFVNLTLEQAKKSVSYLQDKKVILVKGNNNKFKYVLIRKLEKKNKTIKTSTFSIFGVVHEDGDDYHIEVNNEYIDLDKVYIQNGLDAHKWVRLGSIIEPFFYNDRANTTYYVYKNNEKIDKKEGLVQVATIKAISGGLKLEEDEGDYEFNHRIVYKKLRQID
jgi:hypothetical protein